MKNTYFDLIDQTYYFPQEGFDLKNNTLTFHGISLKYLIEKYGTPFRFIYLPKIGDQIKKARNLFNRAIKKNGYKGSYNYCYCTKCNHFSHVIGEAIKHGVHLETSSAFDIDLILNLYEDKKIDKKRTIICNGYKTDEYLKKIVAIQEDGFSNVIVVLDSKTELDRILKVAGKNKIKIGMRMAINEEPQSSYYTSRLGIRENELLAFFKEHIRDNDKVELKMLHFFVDSGIKDNLYYWGEFQKALKLYIQLKRESKALNSFNLGGGFPIRNNLGFEYDYEYIINEIIKNIKEACVEQKIQEPDIYTEFGKYTVGESGAIIFEVLEQKPQNDTETWYIINNSLMNTIPDAWSIHEKFILLPINKWNNEYHRVNIGGISCDHSDYYNSDELNQEVLLPKYSDDEKEPLYLGFFHTGAYQDAISGYGGIKHCLIPSPKHVIIDRDEKGNIVDYVYRNEQSAEDMFKLLGYNKK
ncbi:MAG: arginine decarboxylase [Flavobacteriales bacterium]|nr:arginine decarboxylase [Flavobacteriales bacterium]